MKSKKILMIFMFFIIMLLLITTVSNAFSVGDLTGNTDELRTGPLRVTGNKIIRIVSTIGSIVSVVVIIILGIKYMLGSLEEKAAYKKSMIPYLIGATLIFAASSIAGVIYNIAIQIK